jgi:hypothetical protein
MTRPFPNNNLRGAKFKESLDGPPDNQGMGVDLADAVVRFYQVRFKQDLFAPDFISLNSQFAQPAQDDRGQVRFIVFCPGNKRFDL